MLTRIKRALKVVSRLDRYEVTVEIVDRYWTIQVVTEAYTRAQAIKQVQAQFDEARELGYYVGSFRATYAERM